MNACEKLDIPGMKEHIDYMLIYDFIMANTDRHFGNFGAIRNVETLEWIGPAPIFDSGTSLWHDKLTRAINSFGEIESKPFYNEASKQIELVTDFSRIPFEELELLGNDIREVFVPTEYIDEERIEALVSGVNDRVDKLKEIAAARGKLYRGL